MKVIIDEDAGQVYVNIVGTYEASEVTHTLEKHGVLLHWDGHGRLLGAEFTSPDKQPIDVKYVVMNGSGHAGP